MISVSLSMFFFRFLFDPGAFFRECVRPHSLRFFILAASLAASAGSVGRMGIMCSLANGVLH